MAPQQSRSTAPAQARAQAFTIAALWCVAAAMVLCVGAGRAAADPSYTAAVVEYVYAPQPPAPAGSGGVFNRSAAVAYMQQNVQAFEAYLKAAASGAALNASGAPSPAPQIAVFPEYGVLGWPTGADWTRDSVLPFLEPIPEPGSAAAADPCATADPQLQAVTQALSCLAARYGVTVVADYGDVQQCDPQRTPGCPADGRLQYNTAVAFGPDGSLQAKYHKCHLFGGEVWYFDAANATTPGVACPRATFATAFGVTMELLICYDIMFSAPQEGVRHTAFPTFWVNNLTPPNATEEQQRWTRAYAPQTLLAANIGAEGWESSGSGIWRDGTALAEFVNTSPAPEQQMLLATLPATPYGDD